MRSFAAWVLLVGMSCAGAPDRTESLVESIAEHRAAYDAALDSQEPLRVESAAAGLARLARARYDEILRELRSPEPARQEAAAFALGFSRNRAAAGPLAEAAESANPSLRAFAIAALGMLGSAPVEPFRLRLADEVWQVRQSALFGLRHATGAAIPSALLEAVHLRLDDPVMDVRNEALLVLGRAAQPASIDPIVSRSIRDPEGLVRQNAARALGAMAGAPERILPVLIGMLRDEDAGVVDAAWASLRWTTGQDLDRSHDAWKAWQDASSKPR